MKVSNFERIEQIKKYGENKRRLEEKRLSELNGKIDQLRPKIKALIDTANACMDNGIDINTFETNDRYFECDSYSKGTFVSNEITHRLGFILRGTPMQKKKAVAIGYINGGAYGDYDMFVDENVTYSVDRNDNLRSVANERSMTRFLGDFAEFETAFYKYVDGVLRCH